MGRAKTLETKRATPPQLVVRLDDDLRERLAVEVKRQQAARPWDTSITQSNVVRSLLAEHLPPIEKGKRRG